MKYVNSIQPVVTIKPERYGSGWDTKSSERLMDEIKGLVERHVVPTLMEENLLKCVEVDVEIVEQAECQHCGAEWISENSIYNDGCCEDDVWCPTTRSVEDFFNKLCEDHKFTSSAQAFAGHEFFDVLVKKTGTTVYLINRLKSYLETGDETHIGHAYIFSLLHRCWAYRYQQGAEVIVAPEHRGKIREMAQDWVAWWDARLEKTQ